MPTYTVPGRQSVAGLLSPVLAGLGFAFFWLVPLGILCAGVGLVAGLVGVVWNYAAGGRALWQALAGCLLSAMAPGVNLWTPLMLRGVLPEIY
jgi:hypothetical protein